MDYAIKVDGLTALVAELKRVEAGIDIVYDFGICSNVHAVGLTSLIHGVASQWEHHTGSFAYPIPASKDNLSRGAAHEAYTDAWREVKMWDTDTEYGQLRHEFLEFLLIQAELQLEYWRMRYEHHLQEQLNPDASTSPE